MLAPKAPYPTSTGVAPGQASMAGQYSAALSSHRTPLLGGAHNGTFVSPTESEFSEAFEGPGSVR